MTTSTTSTTASPLVVNGLISGINTQAVIQALLQSYQLPINNLQSEQSTLNSKASDYQTLNTDLQSLMTAANALNTSSQWNLASATTSNGAVATATSSPGAATGSLSFAVSQLAQANLLASTGGVSSTGTVVTSSPSLLLATGGEALGFAGLSAGSGLALGAHSLKVTQSSAAASVTGTAVTTPVTINSLNDTLVLSVNGSPVSLTLASGTYNSASALAGAINTAASGAGVGVSAAATSSGALQLSTTEQGSAATLSVSTTNAALGLTAGQSGTGTNAVVQVDGTATTLSALNPGGSVTLNAPSGTITATLNASAGPSGALVSIGSASAQVVSTGNGSLASVVSAINGAGLGLSASAVQQSNGSYLLQVGATGTGLSGAASVDASAFSGGPLGGLVTLTQAQDAVVQVGGTSGYSVSSSTDTFSGLLAGTAITAVATGQATVTVSPDAAGEATQVGNLVKAANQALSDLQTYAGYDSATKTGGPLMGSSVLSSLQQGILSVFATAAGTSGLGNSSNVGITLNKDGTLSFDSAAFQAAYSANPQKVASLFTQGGTFSPASTSLTGQVSFVYAGNQTAPGTYAVSVSHSATQATDTGSVVAGGSVASSEQLTVTQGSATATYAVTAGASLTSIAAGLNAAFSAQGLGVTASVVSSGTQLQLTSNGYGSAATFQVASNTASGPTGLGGATANTPTSFTGTDVVGTINGVTATGTGQVLAAPTTDPTLQGLSVLVTATGITSATNLGSLTYTPGLAQQLTSIADAATNATSGSITTAIQGLQQQATGLNGQIANYQQLEVSQQQLLQNEFATMEATLGSLKNESSQLSSSLAGLPGL